LVETLGPVDVLEPPLAEIAKTSTRRKVVLDDAARRAGEQNLTAVGGGADPRRLMNP
jgi:hypothetical protein